MAMTPPAFRASVEARLKKIANDDDERRPLNRLRVLMVMERFLARALQILPDTVVLKGGLALELRLDRARTTKDVDLRLLGDPSELEDHLHQIEAFRPDPEDHLEFKIVPDKAITGDGIKYDGLRYKVAATLVGKPYVHFGLDAAFGDPIHGEPEVLVGSDFFERYGIERVSVPMYPPSSHLAEKLHAYTLPRDRVNTRIKDLVDMPLIATVLDGATARDLRAAFGLTFDFRATHALPDVLPSPPELWTERYARLQAEEGLPWPDLDALHQAAASLMDPVLGGHDGVWNAMRHAWQ